MIKRDGLKDPIIKRAILWMALVFLGAILLAYCSEKSQIGQLETVLTARESAVAGHLVATHTISADAIKEAFASRSLTAADQMAGKQLFTGTGYRSTVLPVLLPQLSTTVELFSWITVLISILICALSLWVLFCVLRKVYQGMDRATAQAIRVSRGDFTARMEMATEGTLGRMQSAFNEMTVGVQGAYERLARQRTFLKDWIADISHQLKTPLAALKMYQEIMMQEPMSEPARKFTISSGEQLQRMEWLILGLLKMARIEADRLTLHPVKQSLSALTKKVMNDFMPMAQQKGVSLRFTGEADPQLVCDAAWLGEAIGNVVKNCIESTPPSGQVHLVVKETQMAASLEVHDTGPGIHPDEMPFIFRRFYRGDKRKTSGSGLGLSLARSIVEQMGATLSAGGTYGEGAIFTFLFLRQSM